MAPFKAIIVGGGVGGLTLANILDKLDLDYVLLESYGDIAPQVGASIAMLPAGQRILDQLGCVDGFTKDIPGQEGGGPTRNGKPILKGQALNANITKKLGYGIAFNDRQVLLRTLYDNLRNKDRILLNKRVEKVSTADSGATVMTRDGELFEGDIIVGADGIRSTVRDEMWRIAAENSLGYFKDQMKDVDINYKCLFGIAKPHPKIQMGATIHAMGKGYSYLISGGPDGKVYYFLFVKLPERLGGDKTPRYSNEDALALAKAHSDDLIIEDCTFGHIFAGHVSFGLTPLHEHVFDKWHYGRIITLGDSCHKPNPISGQGGNGAMESVAALANQLKRRMDKLPAGAGLSAADIEAVFRETQEIRHQRAKNFVALSAENQVMNASTSRVSALLAPLAPFIMSEDKTHEFLVGGAVEAVHLEVLPLPFRPYATPFTDQLPARPITKPAQVLLPRVLVGLALLGLTYLAGLGLQFDAKSLKLPENFFGHPFRESFTGNPKIDNTLSVLTKVFSIILASPNPENRLQLIYFLPMLASAVLIWVVEAHRRVNVYTVRGRIFLAWPAVYAILYQLFTIARVGPVYFLVTLVASYNPLYHRPTSRHVDTDVARAVLPALVVGYVLPTVFMLLPLRSNPALWLDFTTLWQIAPVAVGPLTSLFAAGIRAYRRALPPSGGPATAKKKAAMVAAADEKKKKDDTPSSEGPYHITTAVDEELYANRDLPHLLAAYSAVFFASAAVHVSVLVYFFASSSSGLSAARAFFDLPFWPTIATMGPAEAAFSAPWAEGLDALASISVLFRWDLVVFAATLLVWCLHTVFDMRRLGYATTVEAARAAAGVALSLVALGPGAMYAATWYWREKTISGVSRLTEEKAQ